jgi:hypothetical protein
MLTPHNWTLWIRHRWNIHRQWRRQDQNTFDHVFASDILFNITLIAPTILLGYFCLDYNTLMLPLGTLLGYLCLLWCCFLTIDSVHAYRWIGDLYFAVLCCCYTGLWQAQMPISGDPSGQLWLLMLRLHLHIVLVRIIIRFLPIF